MEAIFDLVPFLNGLDHPLHVTFGHKFYGKGVDDILGIEPNVEFLKLAAY